MSKFILFILLWRLLGNPVLAVIVLLILLYILDRRFVGILPSATRPFKRNRMLSRLNQQLQYNPHDTSVKLAIAKLYIEKKRYGQAQRLLEEILPHMEDSAEAWSDLGTVLLHTHQVDKGEHCMNKALELNPRVKFGEPYLRLGEVFADSNPDKALQYLAQFREIHSSSCEAYYMLGAIYEKLGRKAEAKTAYAESLALYRTLPKYMKRQERKWAFKSFLKQTF